MTQTTGLDRYLSKEWTRKQAVALEVRLSGRVLGQLHIALDSIPNSYKRKSLIDIF